MRDAGGTRICPPRWESALIRFRFTSTTGPIAESMFTTAPADWCPYSQFSVTEIASYRPCPTWSCRHVSNRSPNAPMEHPRTSRSSRSPCACTPSLWDGPPPWLGSLGHRGESARTDPRIRTVRLVLDDPNALTASTHLVMTDWDRVNPPHRMP